MKQTQLKYLVFLFGLIPCLKGYPQYSLVKDSVIKKKIYTKIFDLVASHSDTSNWHNFIHFKNENPWLIYYGIPDGANEIKVYDNLITIPPFKETVKANIPDTVIIPITQATHKVKFVVYDKRAPSKVGCYLSASPLIAFNNKIYARLFITSPGFDDDGYGTTFNLVFNNHYELIYIKCGQLFF